MRIAFVMITLAVLGWVMITNQPGPDCDHPATWSTGRGVQACAINGGK